MARRTTMAHLEGLIRRLNRVAGTPETTYNKDGNKWTANIGNFHLDSAYGGYSLVQMMSEGGGVKDVLHCGFTTKSELYSLIYAYISGIEFKEEQQIDCMIEEEERKVA